MTEQTDTIATIANMRRAETMGIHTYVLDLSNNETYSATPGDYFMLPTDAPILDADGDPMVLVTRDPAVYRPLSLGEPDTYATSQIDHILINGPTDCFYRLHLSADGGPSTKSMNITLDELHEIRAILARRTV